MWSGFLAGVLGLLLSVLGKAKSYSTGAPSQVCGSQVPQTPQHQALANGADGYTITPTPNTYTPGQALSSKCIFLFIYLFIFFYFTHKEIWQNVKKSRGRKERKIKKMKKGNENKRKKEEENVKRKREGDIHYNSSFAHWTFHLKELCLLGNLCCLKMHDAIAGHTANSGLHPANY